MSGLVEKVKQRVRSVSLQRTAGDLGSGHENGVHVNSTDVAVPPIAPAYENQAHSAARTSLENSAFHVTTASGRPQSRTQRGPPTHRDPYQESVAVTNGAIEGQERLGPAANIEGIIPDRVSSLPSSQKTIHRYSTGSAFGPVGLGHDGQPQDDRIRPNSAIPSQHRSKEGNFAQSSTSRGGPAPSNALAATSEAMSSPRKSVEQSLPSAAANAKQVRKSRGSDASDVAASSRLTTRKPLPPNADVATPSFNSNETPLPTATERRSEEAEPETQSRPVTAVPPSDGNTVRPPEHVALPKRFVLRNAEQSQVTEQVRPAVVRERVVNERKEIIHKEITRDIHIHHYYTYIQPIKVVEILPPRHFLIDEKTGETVEIARPAGWVVPESMKPISPDYSMVKGWTRHYLVCEEHPNGILEPPSGPVFGPKEDVDNLSTSARL